jgi:hypothetical protein
MTDNRSPQGKPKEVSEKEAEVEREAIRKAISETEGPTRVEMSKHRQQGVSNRSVEEEAREQEKLPPRGQAKED